MASEARAVGATLPDDDPKAIERAGNHYSGLAYPGYAHPSVEEAAEALELARQIVHQWWRLGDVGALRALVMPERPRGPHRRPLASLACASCSAVVPPGISSPRTRQPARRRITVNGHGRYSSCSTDTLMCRVRPGTRSW